MTALPPRNDLATRYGPWALVTGASSGIGRSFAQQLAAAGVNVAIAARRADVLAALAAELEEAYRVSVRVIAADLATDDGVDHVDFATSDLDVGLLVAAAGFGTSGHFANAALAVEREMIAVNCWAVVSQCRRFGDRFRARGRGGIIMIGSLVGWQGVPNSAHYAATKAYVQTLAEGLHSEYRALGIDVLSCAPGPVRSGFEARAGMRMRTAIDPATVARESLKALGRKSTIVPGWLSKVLTFALVPLPRTVRSWLMGRIMADMTAHQGLGAF
jgi:short-subunit dehydrogenase